VRLVVLAPDEHVSHLPEYKSLADPGRLDAQARYVEYAPPLGLIVVGQENVLGDPRDAAVGDNQIIRALAKAIHAICGMRPFDRAFERRPKRSWQQYELRVKRLDVSFDRRLRQLFEASMAVKRWQGTSAVRSASDYWATGVLAYFDAAGQDAKPRDSTHPIRTRELLQAYDPGLFALVNETFAYERRVDWRYSPYAR
jgi:hypothetical protein